MVIEEAKLLQFKKRFKAGYEIRHELVPTVDFHAEVIDQGDDSQATQELVNTINSGSQSGAILMKSAYNLAGNYIGSTRDAHQLCVKRGIAPEKAKESDEVCSIGFCEREQKWYGWSHRAIYGFGVGSEVKEGDCCNSSGYIEEYLNDHPEDDLSLPVEFVAKSLEDAKRMAIAFADSVG